MAPPTQNRRQTHPVENEIPVAELQSTKGHRHPCLDVCGQKDERAILDDDFEVGVQELEDEIEVRFRGEYVHELVDVNKGNMQGERMGVYLDDVLVVEFTKIHDFANGRHVEAIFELPDLYLFYSDFLL